MAEITSIEPQVKDKTRCNVYVDGRFYCGMGLEVVIKYHLKCGMQIEKAQLDSIQLETEKNYALDKAMTHLSATMKTEKQIRDYLEGKGYTQTVQDYVIEKLKYYKLIDDYNYCVSYIESVHGKGKRALEADLMRRGADRNAIARALDEKKEDAGEAYLVLQKYLSGKTYDKKNLYKGFRYLLSKGFDVDTAKEALVRLGDNDEDN